MTPRLTASEYETQKGEGNKRAFKRIVDSGGDTGTAPGVLAYFDDEPVGWCAIQPREAFSRLARSRILQPIDDKPVWSIVCVFTRRDHRRVGLSKKLIEGAVQYARSRGARLIEAYPVEPKTDPMPEVFAYTGIASAFEKAGFREVARRSPTRPIMRRAVRPARSTMAG